jgi:hypothetical protein
MPIRSDKLYVPGKEDEKLWKEVELIQSQNIIIAPPDFERMNMIDIDVSSMGQGEFMFTRQANDENDVRRGHSANNSFVLVKTNDPLFGGQAKFETVGRDISPKSQKSYRPWD